MNKNIIILIILFVLIIILNSVLINSKIEKFFENETSYDILKEGQVDVVNDINALNNKLNEKQTELEEHINNINALNTQIDNLETQLNDEITLSRIPEEKDRLNKELTDLKERKEGLDSELNRLNNLIRDITNSFNEVSAQKEEAEINLNILNNKVEDCRNLYHGESQTEGCVYLYSKKDYKGTQTKLCTTDGFLNNNENRLRYAKSLRVDPGWKVRLYDTPNYNGNILDINNKNRYLIYPKRNTSLTRQYCASRPTSKCCTSTEPNWNEWKTCSKNRENWNNKIKSVTLRRNYNVTC